MIKQKWQREKVTNQLGQKQRHVDDILGEYAGRNTQFPARDWSNLRNTDEVWVNMPSDPLPHYCECLINSLAARKAIGSHGQQ